MDSRLNVIRRQFNRSAASSYDNHAHVQRMMAERLASSLIGSLNIRNHDGLNILEIGCGTGVLTEILLREWSSASITALDLAEAMIEAAQQRVSSSNGQPHRARFLSADIERWASEAEPASFDLIVSNACFQWLRHPRETLRYLRRMLCSGGSLAFTTFGPHTFRELHEAFDEAYRTSGQEPQRHGLSFHTLSQWQLMLEEAGFGRIQYEQSLQMEEYATVRDFLHSVKAVGASTSEASPLPGIGSRRLFANMFKEYEDKFSIPGGIAATYDLLLIHASAP
jgi:malonyl-CoA O-methyltransferase